MSAHARETLRVLREARALLARRNGWTQGHNERFKNGKSQYCATGALLHAALLHEAFIHELAGPSEVLGIAMQALDRELPTWTRFGVEGYNDGRGRRKKDILALYDRAIASVERVEP